MRAPSSENKKTKSYEDCVKLVENGEKIDDECLRHFGIIGNVDERGEGSDFENEGFDFENDGNHISENIFKKAVRSNKDLMQFLKEHKINDTDNSNNNILFHAARHNPEMIPLLLEKGVNPRHLNYEDELVLPTLINFGVGNKENFIKSLKIFAKSLGTKYLTEGKPDLLEYMVEYKPELLLELLKLDLDLDLTKQKYGKNKNMNILQFVASKRIFSAISPLLKKINPKIITQMLNNIVKDGSKVSILDYFKSCKNNKLIAILFAYGAKITKKVDTSQIKKLELVYKTLLEKSELSEKVIRSSINLAYDGLLPITHPIYDEMKRKFKRRKKVSLFD